MTAEEYLALDRAAEFRSEFLDGEIIAMSGGSPRHSGLKMNLAIEVASTSQYLVRGFRLRFPCSGFPSHLCVPGPYCCARKTDAGG
jgi:Putative restriction endonuclease